MRTGLCWLVVAVTAAAVFGGTPMAGAEDITLAYAQPVPNPLPARAQEGVAWRIQNQVAGAPYIHLWLQRLQFSGEAADKLLLQVTDEFGMQKFQQNISAQDVAAGTWKAFHFGPLPALNANWKVSMQCNFNTITAQPTVVVMGALEANITPVLPNPMDPVDLGLLTADPMPGIVPYPPIIFNAGAITPISGTRMVRFGGWGTSLSYSLRRPEGLMDGASSLRVMVNGATKQVIRDTDLTNTVTCYSFTVSPDKLATAAPFDLAFVSTTAAGPPATIFALDNVTVDYLYLTPVVRNQLGLGSLLFPQLNNNSFESGPLDWTVTPAYIPPADVFKGDYACDGAMGAVFAPTGVSQPQACLADATVSNVVMTEAEPWEAVLSDTANLVYQQVDQAGNTITRLRWWGIWKDLGDMACAPMPGIAFTVQTHPAPGAPATATHTEIVDPVALPNNLYPVVGSDAMLFRYDMVLPAGFLGDVFLSVQSMVVPSCKFYWLTGNGGFPPAVDSVATPLSTKALSFCIETAALTTASCFSGADILFEPHLPSDSPYLYLSEVGAPIAQPTPAAVDKPIERIGWWGVWKDGGDVACTPPNNVDFQIVTYTAGSPPTPETTMSVSVAPKPVAGLYYAAAGAPAQLYWFETPPLTGLIGKDYLSVQAPPDSCNFYWVSSADGSVAVDANSGSNKDAAVSLCIKLGQVEDQTCPPEATALNQPPSTGTFEHYTSSPANPILQPTTVVEAIKTVRWWGFWTDSSGTTPIDPPDSALFTVARYRLAGTPIQTDARTRPLSATILANNAYTLGGGVALLCRYEMELPSSFYGDDFLSVQGDAGTTDQFHWMSSDAAAAQVVNSGGAPAGGMPASLCITPRTLPLQTCFDNAVISYPPHTPGDDFEAKESSFANPILQRLALDKPVTNLRWWGLWQDNNIPAGDPTFEILFYDVSRVMTSPVVPTSLTMTKVTPTSTYDVAGVSMDLYYFDAVIPATSGVYLSVQNTTLGHNFLWMSSDETVNRAVDQFSTVFSYAFSLCVEVDDSLDMECAGGGDVNQPPRYPLDPAWKAWPIAGTTLLQRVNAQATVVKKVRWWGIWKNANGIPEDPGAISAGFILKTYDDGYVETGTATITVALQPIGYVLYPVRGQNARLYLAEADLTDFVGDTYLSIQPETSTITENFFWMNGNGSMPVVDELGNSLLNPLGQPESMSLCLEKALPDPMECDSDAEIGQIPSSAPNAAAFESSLADKVLQPVNMTEPIKSIRWWGFWTDGGAPIAPPSATFTIESLRNVSSLRVTGSYSTNAATPTVLSNNIYKVGTQWAKLCQYDVELPSNFYGDAFISIQGNSASGAFQWLSSDPGPPEAQKPLGSNLGAPASICISTRTPSTQECFPESVLSFLPHAPNDDYVMTSQVVLQPLGFSLPIKKIRWWGLWENNSIPPTPTFDVVFYNSPPTISTITPATVIPQPKSDIYVDGGGTNLTLYEFEAVIDAPGGGYLSVQNTTPGHTFFWLSADDTTRAARDVNGIPLPSFCAFSLCVEFDDMTEMVCEENANFTQTPRYPLDPVGPQAYPITGVLMEKIDAAGAINSLRWWGVWKDADGLPFDPVGAVDFTVNSYNESFELTDSKTVSVTPQKVHYMVYPINNQGAALHVMNATSVNLIGDTYLSIAPADTQSQQFYWMNAVASPSPGEPASDALSLCVKYASGTSMECSDTIDLRFSRPAMDPPYAILRPSTKANGLWEQVPITNSLKFIEWWGVGKSGANACDLPYSPDMFIVRYTKLTDLGSAGHDDLKTVPGRLVKPVEAGGWTDGPNAFKIYRFGFVFDEMLDVEQGWLSIQQADDAAECTFHWAPSSDYGGNAKSMDSDFNVTDINLTLGMCLHSTTPVPTISSCSIAPLTIGKGQTATLTLTGANLRFVDELLLLPQIGGDPNQISTYKSFPINLVGEEESTTVTVDIPPSGLNGPTILADDGTTTICTDGRASFVLRSNGVPIDQDCNTLLIDTVAPRLVFSAGGDVYNASDLAASPRIEIEVDPTASDLPSIYNMARVGSPKHTIGTPSQVDVHVYSNAGTRSDVPYKYAGEPRPTMKLTVTAQFEDVPPDGYDVEISGFADTSTDTAAPFSPIPGEAYWKNVGSFGSIGAKTREFIASGINNRSLTAEWRLDDVSALFEPTRLDFTLTPMDLAGNESDIIYNDVRKNKTTIWWLWRTRARITSQIDSTATMPEIFWTLDRGFAAPTGAIAANCPPLAKFRLYSEDAPGVLQFRGDSAWLTGPLHGGVRLAPNGFTVQAILNQEYLRERRMYLAVLGADETGNVQYDPGPNNIATEAELVAYGIHYISWVNGQRRQDNLAVDTSLRLELFHERYEVTGRYRNYGTATRVPLPLLAEACEIRVNGLVTMQPLLPTADQRQVVGNIPVIWKLYKEGALVARGVVPVVPTQVNGDGSYSFDLMDMLWNCERKDYTVADLGDLKDVGGVPTLIVDNRALNWDTFLAGPPTYCLETKNYFKLRLGDEGNPPDAKYPNAPSKRKREIRYTLTAQTAAQFGERLVFDQSPATVSFSIYVRDYEDQIRDEAPIREFGRQ